MDFAVSSDHRIKLKEIKKRDKYLDLAREIKKIWNIKVAMIPIVIVMLGKDTKGMVKGMVKGIEDSEIILGDHLRYNIIKISQNTEKNPGDQRRLAVTQTPVENYQLTVV